MKRITRDQTLWAATTAIACAAAIGLAALAAHDNGATELEAMQQTALAVEDASDAAKATGHPDQLFNRRVQLAGDTVCIRTAGPGYRATWSGPDETLHCVLKAQPERPRLLLAESSR